MKLSIIVPVYNTAANGVLEYCLNSLVNQTFIKKGGDMEIIAVDDCSTDNSLNILQSYENTYPKIFRAIHSDKNRGPGGARNLGFKHAKGEWIGYIDSDDWVAPDCYEKALSATSVGAVDTVAFAYSRVNHHTFSAGTPIHHQGLIKSGIMNDEKYKYMILDGGPCVTKIFKRQVLFGNETVNKDCRVFPENVLYEDNAITFRTFLRINHLVYLPEALYFYFQRLGSITHSLTGKSLSDRWNTSHMILEIAQKEGYLQKYWSEIEFRFTEIFYVNTLNMVMPYEFEQKQKFITDLIREQKRLFPDFQKNFYYQRRIEPHLRGMANLLTNILL